MRLVRHPVKKIRPSLSDGVMRILAGTGPEAGKRTPTDAFLVLNLVLKRLRRTPGTCFDHKESRCASALLTAAIVILHCLVSSHSAQAELSVSELSTSGRPADLYTEASTPASEFKAQCDSLLRSLNEPIRGPNTDVRTALLQSSFSADWAEETVTDLPSKLGLSELRTTEIPGPQGNYSVAVFSSLVHDRLQDEAFVFSFGLQHLREESGVMGDTFLEHIKAGADPDVHRIVTQPLWKSEVARRATADAEAIVPLSGDAYWFDVVVISQTPLALITPPVAFGPDGKLRRRIEVFAITLDARGLGNKVCHFATKD